MPCAAEPLTCSVGAGAGGQGDAPDHRDEPLRQAGQRCAHAACRHAPPPQNGMGPSLMYP